MLATLHSSIWFMNFSWLKKITLRLICFTIIKYNIVGHQCKEPKIAVQRHMLPNPDLGCTSPSPNDCPHPNPAKTVVGHPDGLKVNRQQVSDFVFTAGPQWQDWFGPRSSPSSWWCMELQSPWMSHICPSADVDSLGQLEEKHIYVLIPHSCINSVHVNFYT